MDLGDIVACLGNEFLHPLRVCLGPDSVTEAGRRASARAPAAIDLKQWRRVGNSSGGFRTISCPWGHPVAGRFRGAQAMYPDDG